MLRCKFFGQSNPKVKKIFREFVDVTKNIPNNKVKLIIIIPSVKSINLVIPLFYKNKFLVSLEREKNHKCINHKSSVDTYKCVSVYKSFISL